MSNYFCGSFVSKRGKTWNIFATTINHWFVDVVKLWAYYYLLWGLAILLRKLKVCNIHINMYRVTLQFCIQWFCSQWLKYDNCENALSLYRHSSTNSFMIIFYNLHWCVHLFNEISDKIVVENIRMKFNNQAHKTSTKIFHKLLFSLSRYVWKCW